MRPPPIRTPGAKDSYLAAAFPLSLVGSSSRLRHLGTTLTGTPPSPGWIDRQEGKAMHPIMLKYVAEARMEDTRRVALPKFETTRIRRRRTRVATRRVGFGRTPAPVTP